MKVIKGQFNIAKIMLPEGVEMEENVLIQIYEFLNHPVSKGRPVVIMPDCHAGAGCVIGFTFPMNDYIVPNLVGVDIGCGMRSINLGDIDIDVKKLDNFIKNKIPSGFSVNSKIDQSFYDVECELMADVYEVSKRIGSDPERNLKSLGTLGSGNHFCELGVDENGDQWLTVHTGSRKFGLDIANYYQNKARDLMSKMLVDVYKHKGLEYLHMELGGENYLNHMRVAQHFAIFNRQIIVDKIVGYLFQEAGNIELRDYSWDEVESIHNYIDFTDGIIRKGAIKADKGQRVIIPFNMEDGLIIGTGKGNEDWNNSAPHGAGRVLSRNQAKATLSLKEAKKSMKEKGIYTTSLTKDSLDEAKGAYKDKEMIIEAIKDTIKIDCFVKPIYNFKAN